MLQISTGLTLNIADVRSAISHLHFTELLVPPAPSDLTCVETSPSALVLTWKCETVCSDANTLTLQQRRFDDTYADVC